MSIEINNYIQVMKPVSTKLNPNIRLKNKVWVTFLTLKYLLLFSEIKSPQIPGNLRHSFNQMRSPFSIYKFLASKLPKVVWSPEISLQNSFSHKSLTQAINTKL